MTGLVILDVAIGLIFAFLLISLLCTAINEWLSNLFKLRAKTLRSGVQQLLGDPLLQKFVYEHPLIQSLKGDKRFERVRRIWSDRIEPPARKFLKDPSHIASSTFAKAVIGTFFEKDAAGNYKLSELWSNSAAFEAELKNALGDDYEKRLEHYVGVKKAKDAAAFVKKVDSLREKIGARVTWLANGLTGGGPINEETIEKNLSKRFDETMDRASGWYKRQMHRIAFGIGLVIAVALNASTATIVDALARDQDLRNNFASVGSRIASECTVEAMRDPQNEKCRYTGELLKVRDSTISLPFGWYPKYVPWNQPGASDWRIGAWMLLWILGFIATAFAAKLGAPFWFETLQKVAKIKASGIATGREATR